jgi:GTP cyclohydrolase I
VQERLTQQIMEELKSALKTNDVAVVIDAAHMCVATRGIEDVNSSTVTAAISGQFKDEATRAEFLKYISLGN